jgi:enoyl-CoA hydratase/carnithine racemase
MRIAKNINFLFSQLVKLSTYPAPFEQVAKLELDNPKKKNALSVELLSQVLILTSSLTPPFKK